MAKKKRRNRRPNPVAPLSNQQINHLANQILHPIQAQANNQAQAAQGFGTALANIYGDIAPTVQSAYNNAANQTASYANGFSTGLQLLGQQQGQQSADALAAQGAPEAQQQAVQNVGAGASDALYGAGGYLPASSLQREGAAFTAAAAMAPTYAGRQGQQDATRLRMEALQQIAQQRPQLIQQLRDFELQKYAARINAGYLANARAGTRIDAFNAQANAAHQAAQDAQDAQDAKDERRGNRQEFWNDTHNDVLDKAEQFANREIPNPNPFGDSDTIKAPLGYKEAMRRLWNAYGDDLRKRGFSRDRIKRMFDRSLRANGIKPPPAWGHVGEEPLPHD